MQFKYNVIRVVQYNTDDKFIIHNSQFIIIYTSTVRTFQGIIPNKRQCTDEFLTTPKAHQIKRTASTGSCSLRHCEF